eukprot:401452-Pleurochrysis_carterae.AAC.1
MAVKELFTGAACMTHRRIAVQRCSATDRAFENRAEDVRSETAVQSTDGTANVVDAVNGVFDHPSGMVDDTENPSSGPLPVDGDAT